MEQENLRLYERKLMKDRDRLAAELAQTENMGMNLPLTESIQELSAYDNHPADLGSETFERGKDLAIRYQLDKTYQQTVDALERIRMGNYGNCKRCGEEIKPERLEAIPAASFCLDCQGEVEETSQNRTRPVEEEVLGPPFGRTYLDGTDVMAFDGEDAFQAVARYGTSESPSDLGGTDSYEDMYEDDHDGERKLIIG